MEVTRLRDLKISARDQLMLDPRTIIIEKGYNPRNYRLPENHAHLDSLKESIRAVGVLQPLLVRFDPQEKAAVLVDGECRLKAVLELIEAGVEIESVPTIQVPGNNAADRLVLTLTANTGKPLSKWEAGGAFRRFVSYGWEKEKIAEKLGFSLRYITEALELADAPDEVKQLLSERAVTPALALDHIRKSGAGAVMTLRASVGEAHKDGKQTAKKSHQPGRSLKGLVLALLKGVEEETLTNESYEFVEVNRKRLIKLAEAVR